MKISVLRSAPLAAVALAFALFSPSAKAAPVSFNCVSAADCAGTVTATYSGASTLTSASTSGLTVTNSSGPADDVTLKFTLKFDTTTGTVSITEIGGVDTSTIKGTIIAPATGTTASSGGITVDTLSMSVNFGTLPADFQTFLGASTGVGGITNIKITTSGSSSGPAQSASVLIVGAAPEPASYLLMGTGLLLCAFFLRRGIGSSATVA